MPLDPIVSLSVAIAEAAGSHAFLLGSGVSREAGVPTGEQVFWQAVGELYRLETETAETPERAELARWLAESDRADFGYSQILELIAPDPANRRDYLAKHFEAKQPGAAHHDLASLAEEGTIRVFVTTNFDRLLEQALQARGIEPVIVTSAADLESAPRREHAQSYVLKPHGDYLQETIRNTPSELADLEPEIAAELKEIFDRFGVAVLGYSGSDAGIGGLLRVRRSRYGLYWVTRRELGDGADRIVEAAGGRVIKREGAAEFVADLRRRLDVFQAHPSGHTPVEVHDEILALIRSKDEIGLAEVMRRERRQFGDHLSEIIAGYREERPDENTLLDAHDQMLPVMERRVAGLLPVITYAPASFDREVRSLVELLQDRPIVGGFTAWTEVLDWATWWLGYVCGAFALFQEAWEPLKAILDARYSNWNDAQSFLVEPVRESVGQDLGRFVMARFSDTKWLVSRWEHLTWSVAGSEVLKERWPEFLRGEEPKFPALLDFDLLVSVKFGLEEQQPLAHWGMYSGGGVRLARRLRNDLAYRQRVARLLAIGEEEEDFIDRVVAAGRLARSPDFPNSGALRILASGRD